MLQKKKSIFTEGEGCECEQCSPLEETCPEDSTPKGGRCARADNSGYLKGKCDKGHTWDSKTDKCVAMAKESTVSAYRPLFNLKGQRLSA
jgi:hypothetical protein